MGGFLRTTEVVEGAAVRRTTYRDCTRGAEWLEDGTIVFCPFYYEGIERVASSGGAVTVVSKVDRAAGELSHRWPHSLPGGKVILYSVGLGSSWDTARVVAHRLDTGERKAC